MPVVCDVAIHFSGFIVRISEAKRSDAHNVWVYDYMRMCLFVCPCACIAGVDVAVFTISPDMGIEFSASLTKRFVNE